MLSYLIHVFVLLRITEPTDLIEMQFIIAEMKINWQTSDTKQFYQQTFPNSSQFLFEYNFCHFNLNFKTEPNIVTVFSLDLIFVTETIYFAHFKAFVHLFRWIIF